MTQWVQIESKIALSLKLTLPYAKNCSEQELPHKALIYDPIRKSARFAERLLSAALYWDIHKLR